MRLFFAGFHESRVKNYLSPEFIKSICVLGSYYYLSTKTHRKNFDPTISRDFILDCGAFSFVFGSNAEGASQGVNWKEYIREYANFIKEFKVQRYMELDIDAIVGYDRVVQYRNMLEDLVGWPSIPVYHVGRTDEQFVEIDCKNRPYVAYGTNIGETAKNNANVAKISNLAHEQGCKIHLLGVSDPMAMKDTGIVVDSCDASTWIMNAVYGRRIKFNPGDKKISTYRVLKTEQIKPRYKENAVNIALWRKASIWMAQNTDVIWEEDKAPFSTIDEDSMTTEQIVEKYRDMTIV